MCRMFGMVASEEEKVEGWLAGEGPSIESLARKDKSGCGNRDGWGIGWYSEGEAQPTVVKEPVPADTSLAFRRTARALRSPVVVAHVRRSSGTGHTLENTHPFVWQNWLFCHNGACDGSSLKRILLPEFAARVLGGTDSEVYFACLMQHLRAQPDPVKALRAGVSAAIVAGAHTGLNFLLTNGRVMYALHSSSEPDRHSLYLAEVPGMTVVASEPLGTALWTEIPDGWLAILTREGHLMVQLVPAGAVIE